MEKLTFLKNHRPKSARNYKYSFTNSNNYYNCFNKTNTKFPNIRDKINKTNFNYSKRDMIHNFPEYSHKSFFMSSTPFYYFRNKNKKNEFCICYNGGPRKNVSMNKKKLSLCLNKINNFSNFSNFSKKKIKNNIYPIATEGNTQKNKIKFNCKCDRLDEEEKKINNNNRYINPVMNTEQNLIRSKINDKEEEKNKGYEGFFTKYSILKRRFNKIQIHNNCKPFLVDDFRYYSEYY